MKLTLEGNVLSQLQLWLSSREIDIANDFEDFGELQYVFEKVIGWKARNVIK